MKIFQYQNKKKTNYFEGWYFRFTTTENENYAVIFALTKNKKDPHSFIQVFKNNDEEGIYLRYPVEDFSYNHETYEVTIQNHTLSPQKIILNYENLHFNITFQQMDTLNEKSAMGFLSNVPLQCFQEVVYIDGTAKGFINEKQVYGKIYLEKTYGSKFPVKWIWIQSNHSINHSSISFSVGLIPMMFFMSKGFLAILKNKDKIYHFYTGNLSKIDIQEDKISISKGRYKLILIPKGKNFTKLLGPMKDSYMGLQVLESINSQLDVILYDRNEIIFEDSYTNVGYEHMWKK